ncbi:MAG TPA: aminoacetone oxidase family FAD-binding enzyme [Lachnospiraceae bacterium]|nr:aminoacetone oxidase family FAD-binding enzyme [Lachnospiraceae bacterium]
MKIGIIGAGASGLCAAVTCARCGNEVTLIEHGERAGRKLLSTGNGKCNLSNTDRSLSHYHGDPAFIKNVYDRVSFDSVISFLTGLGIFTRNRNGYLYPYSEQASAVLDVLRFAVRDTGVKLCTCEHVCGITVEGSGRLSVHTEKPSETDRSFDRLILCTGSRAAPVTGSDGSGYELARKLGHSIKEPLPALTYLRSDAPYCRELKGIRLSGRVTVFFDKEMAGTEEGELQFTETGISGIPVFQLSHLVSERLFEKKGRGRISASIDLLPFMSVNELASFLKDRKERWPMRSAGELLTGLLPKNMSFLMNRLCGIKNSLRVSELSDEQLLKLSESIKGLSFNITGTGGFDRAQVCAGGVRTEEITDRLESELVKGLYFAGEIIDVHGDCGGYNLTWAFATGILAGISASEEY